MLQNKLHKGRKRSTKGMRVGQHRSEQNILGIGHSRRRKEVDREIEQELGGEAQVQGEVGGEDKGAEQGEDSGEGAEGAGPADGEVRGGGGDNN